MPDVTLCGSSEAVIARAILLHGLGTVSTPDKHISAKMTSLEIFDMHFVKFTVFINIRTNLLMKITLHDHECKV